MSSVKISVAFSEVLANLAAELNLAIQWDRPSILIAIYKTESTRVRAEKILEQEVGKTSRRIERIQVDAAQPDILQIIRQTGDPERVIFSITGLRNGGGIEGKDAYRALNLHRETFVEQRYRSVLWLTEAEAKNLPRFAPDFWAFRHRVFEFASDRARLENALPSGVLLWHSGDADRFPEKIQETIQYYKHSLASLPETSEAVSMRVEILFTLAHLEWLRGELESASKRLSAGSELADKLNVTQAKGRFLNAKGIVSYEADNKREALFRFGKAAEHDPRDGLPLINLAITYQALGQRQNAVIASKRAVKLDPQNPRIWNAAGHLYLAGGQLEAAQASFERAVALERGHPFYQLGLAVCQSRSGESEKAGKTVKSIEQPIGPLADYQHACKKILAGEMDEAIDILKNSMKKNDILVFYYRRDPVLGYILDVEDFETMI